MRKNKENKSVLNIIKKLPFLLFYPAAILLVDWAKDNAEKVEKIYSTGIYPYISQAISFLFSGVNISVAEVLIYALIIIVPLGLVITLSNKKNIGYNFFNYIVTLLCIAAVGYFVFIGAWGLNYYRLPLADIVGYDVQASSTEELAELCEALIEDANNFRVGLEEDEKGVFVLPYEVDELFDKIDEMYTKFGEDVSVFAGSYSSPKSIWQSERMCYTEITGIYIPFTAEANVNVAVMPISIASTAAHEAAHQRGFAREDEANFISYIVCRDYGDQYTKYSGTILALINAMNALYSSDQELYYELRVKYSDSVNRDLIAKSEFWQQYEGEIAEKAEAVNNSYLISNNQDDGVKSYGRMVDLLIAERR